MKTSSLGAKKKSKGKDLPLAATENKGSPATAGGQWNLCLYVAGQTAKSVAALANLNAFCKEHLNGAYKVEVIDLQKEPWHARRDQIVAIPTLIRRMPVPVRRIIGDLSNKERVLIGFDLKRTGESSFNAGQ